MTILKAISDLKQYNKNAIPMCISSTIYAEHILKVQVTGQRSRLTTDLGRRPLPGEETRAYFIYRDPALVQTGPIVSLPVTRNTSDGPRTSK